MVPPERPTTGAAADRVCHKSVPRGEAVVAGSPLGVTLRVERKPRGPTMRAVLSWTLWPLTVVGLLAWILFSGDLGNPDALYGVMGRGVLVSLVVLMGLELLLPYRADWRWLGDRDLWRDIGHVFLYGLVGGALAQLVFLSGAKTLLQPLHWRGIWPTGSPLVVQALLVVILGDMLEYWLHRLSHTLPTLWRVHAVHHMPTRLHQLKAGRHHIAYFLLRGLLVWTPLLLIGVPPALIVWQFIGIGLTGNVAHANIDFKIPAFMHRVLVTPEFHRLHHSTDARQGNSNYGVLLPIWDMLFGTHTPVATSSLPGVGIEGDPIPHQWLTELAWPFLVTRGRQRE
jgi:sterol desaturase/sphingolipid hydroxylase (fatty acid hydroxylase superfamily)